jgi:hypothetical protein
MTIRPPTRIPELDHQDRESERAHRLLEHTCSTLEHAAPDEDLGQKAQSLRGAAIVAQSAIAELWTAVGWYEAATVAQHHGLPEDQ